MATRLIGVHDLGSEAVRAHVVQVLRAVGVETVPAGAGSPFDPESHRAVDTSAAAEGVGETGEGAEPGTVARVVRPGWRHGTRVLRPAEVVVWTR